MEKSTYLSQPSWKYLKQTSKVKKKNSDTKSLNAKGQKLPSSLGICIFMITSFLFTPLANANTNINAEKQVPIRYIPQKFKSQFSMNSLVGFSRNFADKRTNAFKLITEKEMATSQSTLDEHKSPFFFMTNSWIKKALDDRLETIPGKEIAVFAKHTPFMETLINGYGGDVTLMHKGDTICSCPDFRALDENLLFKDEAYADTTFDWIFSILDINDRGLGSYGESIDPDADIKMMQNMKSHLSDDGFLFLVVPIGPDILVWNTNRVYGNARLNKLLDGFSIVDYYGYDQAALNEASYADGRYQPVLILQKK